MNDYETKHTAREYNLLFATKLLMKDVYMALHGEDPNEPGQYYARVMLRSLERQSSQEKQRLIERVREISRETFPARENAPPARVTGYFVLLASLIDSMVRDRWSAEEIARLLKTLPEQRKELANSLRKREEKKKKSRGWLLDLMDDMLR